MRRFRRLTARAGDCRRGLASLDPTDPSLAGCASRVLALSAACTPLGDCFVCVVALPPPPRPSLCCRRRANYEKELRELEDEINSRVSKHPMDAYVL